MIEKKLLKIRKTISLIVIFIMIASRSFGFVVLAQEAEEPTPTPTVTQSLSTEISPTPTPQETITPTPTPETSIGNDADLENNIDSQSNTGDNDIVQATPTPTPQETITPTPEPDLELSQASTQSAALEPTPTPTISCSQEDLEIDSTCVSPVGQNQQGDSSSDQESSNTSDNPSIQTGDSVSVVEAENDVNSTIVGSNVVFQTINIFIDGDIDLSINPIAIVENILSKDKNSDPVVNVSAISGENYAYLENNIVSIANSGDNSIEDGSNAIIDTGNSYSIVSLLNNVNTTIIDSTIHIITINIYGDIEANIILPEFDNVGQEPCCAEDESATIANNAQVVNNVDSFANTGQNTTKITDATGSASIQTGDASSAVNVVNTVNSTYINTYFRYLNINVLGAWLGSFLGWDELQALAGGQSLLINAMDNQGSGGDQCVGCVGDASIQNNAQVINNISSYANTGANTTSSDNASIKTGNAYSSVSLINLINTSIINSTGFYGFINIFNSLKGDIGGESEFIVEEPVVEVEEVKNNEQSPTVYEKGGELTIYQYHNVNDFVYPGDVVTFFVTVRNPGTGTVYDASLIIDLYLDNINMGGIVFPIGDIKPGKGYQITTGLQLSDQSPQATYMAHAQVSGFVGPDYHEISQYQDTWFDIKSNYSAYSQESKNVVEGVSASSMVPENPQGQVLSAQSKAIMEERIKFLFMALLSVYVPTKGFQKRKQLIYIFGKSTKIIGEKALAFRSFFTSFFT